MSLWRDPKETGFKYLCLTNLNQDSLENLFGHVRQHGIFNANPTWHQFVAALKTVVINNSSSPLSKGNCEIDFCDTLVDFRVFFFDKYDD
ncbi:unnamed protein product [Acanthoscelides obtectus]|uniref:Transposable element P transposase-like RNase H C-terminal domain-containing protein n=1 Tax=Acanthoscelides obtectus TaxID=200917 RepID=A0A9P0JVM8_ACAOB|nr:unnamed protein product [Acanthoscelides obtectus]CAK1623793.1 hypothetical protein AOBTE_LOCUS2187 [Acanthoscelides obtectus]